jgi:hypothetical protein
MSATTAINHCDSAAAHDGEPGAAMRAVADKLAAHGFDVRGPGWAEGRCLRVTNLPGTTCDVTVEDDGFAVWEYWRGASKGADPDRLTGLVMRLLTGDSAGRPRAGAASRNFTAGLQGIVGRELRAKGLDVDLDVYADHASFEVVAEIVVTNPAHPERGQVRVGGEAGLMWESGYCGEPGTDAAAIADTIITVLAEDIEDGYVQRGEPVVACGGRGNG